MAKLSLISIAAPPATEVDDFITSPKKIRNKQPQLSLSSSILLRRLCNSTKFWLFLLSAFAWASMFKSSLILFLLRPIKFNPCTMNSEARFYMTNSRHSQHHHHSSSSMMLLPPHKFKNNMSALELEFWKQPDDLGYKPCIDFSREYIQASSQVTQQRHKFLMVVVNGGLNQQRHQIVDAVLIARILEAALVIPVLQVNQIWEDESEFADIFDVEHFKTTLKDDIRVVSSLPSTHVLSRPVLQSNMPMHASPQWIRSNYVRKLRRDGVLLLRGLDSRLADELPSDLQKLKCKVAFHALRFAPSVQMLGETLAKRMWKDGPYLALHLRLEKDVWIRTGCLPGLGSEFDDEVKKERQAKPNLLTSKSNMTYEERRNSGLCPLTAAEVARVLKSLGATKKTRIYWAGGSPYGGSKALEPLAKEFPLLLNKHKIAQSRELEPFENKASSLAAIDYVVAMNSDVFMPSHGGNMGHALKGHRAYTGHRKFITPQKRDLMQVFSNSTMSEDEVENSIREMHKESVGKPQLWSDRRGRDVLAYPVPDCLCHRNTFDFKQYM